MRERSCTLDMPVAEAIPAVKEALQAQGFGTLTEIDLRATLKAKLGVEVEPTVILGACNPGLAHRALEAEPDVGLLLPCNVVVRSRAGVTEVAAVDPQLLVDALQRPGVQEVADEAGRLLDAAIASLRDVPVSP